MPRSVATRDATAAGESSVDIASLTACALEDCSCSDRKSARIGPDGQHRSQNAIIKLAFPHLKRLPPTCIIPFETTGRISLARAVSRTFLRPGRAFAYIRSAQSVTIRRQSFAAPVVSAIVHTKLLWLCSVAVFTAVSTTPPESPVKKQPTFS